MSQDPPTNSGSRIRQVEAISNGSVIDHIPTAVTLKVAAMLAGSGDQLFIGANLRSSRIGRKGVVKIAGREISAHAASCLALLAPGATVSIIHDYQVIRKLPVEVPAEFVDVARCADKAATLLAALGEPARARDSLALARAQWLALQRPDEAADCDRRAAALGKAPPA